MSNYEKRIKKNIEKQKNQKQELKPSTKEMISLIKIFIIVITIIAAVAVLTYFIK